ncbi:MAG: hypothetical protein ACP5I8_08520 [Phycisphaerae bacterium]
MPDIIQGKWDDLVKSHDLHGQTVRVIVLDQQGTENPWIRSLRAWADSHKPLGHRVVDNRESIYSGTTDDPR